MEDLGGMLCLPPIFLLLYRPIGARRDFVPIDHKQQSKKKNMRNRKNGIWNRAVALLLGWNIALRSPEWADQCWPLKVAIVAY